VCAQLASLSLAELGALWQKYLDSFCRCILDSGWDTATPAGRRLSRLYWESSVYWSSMQIRHPEQFAVSADMHKESRRDNACRTRKAFCQCWYDYIALVETTAAALGSARLQPDAARHHLTRQVQILESEAVLESGRSDHRPAGRRSSIQHIESKAEAGKCI
jgi:hypothetical protein